MMRPTEYNYGTSMNLLIDYYKEMMELIVQARIASDRVDEWKKVLDLVTNPDQTSMAIQRRILRALEIYERSKI